MYLKWGFFCLFGNKTEVLSLENVEKKSIFSTLKGKVSALTMTVGVSCMAMALPAFAEEAEKKDKAKEALENAGISTGSSITDITNENSLMSSMQDLVYIIMGIGALWAVAWIIIGGMLLSGSGSNPQKRSGGLVAIAVACVGVYVIYKSYTIAAWAAAL